MPQTSPMNWTILSTMMLLSMMNILSHNSMEKLSQPKNKKDKFTLKSISWNW